MVRRHQMLTVGVDGVAVERRLAAGGLSCPGCGGVLAGWGYARERGVRGWAGVVRVCPRRTRCRGCGVTHVLLPVVVLLRRADTAAVIGAAFGAKAAGVGFRRIAAVLGRPAETVRGWLRRFGARLEAVRGVFTVLVGALVADPDRVLPAPAGGAWPDAVAAIAAAARAATVRFRLVVVVPVWELAVAVSSGRLLAPGWPASRRARATRVAPSGGGRGL